MPSLENQEPLQQNPKEDTLTAQNISKASMGKSPSGDTESVSNDAKQAPLRARWSKHAAGGGRSRGTEVGEITDLASIKGTLHTEGPPSEGARPQRSSERTFRPRADNERSERPPRPLTRAGSNWGHGRHHGSSSSVTETSRSSAQGHSSAPAREGDKFSNLQRGPANVKKSNSLFSKILSFVKSFFGGSSKEKRSSDSFPRGRGRPRRSDKDHFRHSSFSGNRPSGFKSDNPQGDGSERGSSKPFSRGYNKPGRKPFNKKQA